MKSMQKCCSIPWLLSAYIIQHVEKCIEISTPHTNTYSYTHISAWKTGKILVRLVDCIDAIVLDDILWVLQDIHTGGSGVKCTQDLSVRARGMAQMVEYLPSKYEALRSNASITKKKRSFCIIFYNCMWIYNVLK
jgi:hypothetical protein